jgi:rhodanese-related sulfurtransferase
MQMKSYAPTMRRAVMALPIVGVAWWLFNQDPQPAPNIVEVSLEQAKAMVEAGALVLDVRNGDGYGFRHIVGALPVPLNVLRQAIPASLEYAKSQPILVYCNTGLSIGPEATRILNSAGFSGAVNLQAGIEGWDKAGLPVKRAG